MSSRLGTTLIFKKTENGWSSQIKPPEPLKSCLKFSNPSDLSQSTKGDKKITFHKKILKMPENKSPTFEWTYIHPQDLEPGEKVFKVQLQYYTLIEHGLKRREGRPKLYFEDDQKASRYTQMMELIYKEHNMELLEDRSFTTTQDDVKVFRLDHQEAHQTAKQLHLELK